MRITVYEYLTYGRWAVSFAFRFTQNPVFKFIFVKILMQSTSMRVYMLHTCRIDMCLSMSRFTHHSSMADQALMTLHPNCWSSPQHGTYGSVCSASGHSMQTSWPLAIGTSETLTLLSQDAWVSAVSLTTLNDLFQDVFFGSFWLAMTTSCHLWQCFVDDGPSIHSSGLLAPSYPSP